MTKENIIDLAAYRDQINPKNEKQAQYSISNELEIAIELLIERLRELGPAQKVNEQ